jgi:hypothetical protein
MTWLKSLDIEFNSANRPRPEPAPQAPPESAAQGMEGTDTDEMLTLMLAELLRRRQQP